MGDSAKLPNSGPGRYTYAEQRSFLFGLWEELKLGNEIVFVVHDWGSALGFDWANQHRDRVQGIAYMEAVAMPMEWSDFPQFGRDTFTSGINSVPRQSRSIPIATFLALDDRRPGTPSLRS
jgi:haloalkane dehalogenase